jgi:hypothetical protein
MMSRFSRRFVRQFHFASPAYNKAFVARPAADRSVLSAAALAALDNASATKALWHSQPVCSLLAGRKLEGGARVDTTDAFGLVSGSQLLATADELAALTEHVTTFAPPRTDLRGPVRRAEATMLSDKWAGALIANQ